MFKYFLHIMSGTGVTVQEWFSHDSASVMVPYPRVLAVFRYMMYDLMDPFTRSTIFLRL